MLFIFKIINYYTFIRSKFLTIFKHLLKITAKLSLFLYLSIRL